MGHTPQEESGKIDQVRTLTDVNGYVSPSDLLKVYQNLTFLGSIEDLIDLEIKLVLDAFFSKFFQNFRFPFSSQKLPGFPAQGHRRVLGIDAKQV